MIRIIKAKRHGTHIFGYALARRLLNNKQTSTIDISSTIDKSRLVIIEGALINFKTLANSCDSQPQSAHVEHSRKRLSTSISSKNAPGAR